MFQILLEYRSRAPGPDDQILSKKTYIYLHLNVCNNGFIKQILNYWCCLSETRSNVLSSQSITHVYESKWCDKDLMSSIHDTINDSHNKFDLNQFALTARKRKKNIFPITTINKLVVFFWNHINLGIFKKSVFQLEILFTSLSNYVCQILNIYLIRAI